MKTRSWVPVVPASLAWVLASLLVADPERVLRACGGAAASCGALVRLAPESLALPFPIAPLGALGCGLLVVLLIVSRRAAWPLAWTLCGAELYLVGVMLLVHGTACAICLVFAALVLGTIVSMHVCLGVDRVRARTSLFVVGSVAVALALLHPRTPPLSDPGSNPGSEILATSIGRADAALVVELFVAPGCPYCTDQLRALASEAARRTDLLVVVRHVLLDATDEGRRNVELELAIALAEGRDVWSTGRRGIELAPPAPPFDLPLARAIAERLEADRRRVARAGIYATPTALVHRGGALVRRHVGRVSLEEIL